MIGAGLVAVALAAGPEALTLARALDLAREHRPSLREARAGVWAGGARSRQGLAALLPTASASFGYDHSTRTGATPSGADDWSGALQLQATLFEFGRNWYAWQASRAQEDGLRAQGTTAEVAAAAAVRGAYFEAAAQRDLVKVAEANLANTQAHLDQISGFVKAGARPEIDLAQTRADHASARLALVQARSAYAVARARLKVAMGLEAGDFEPTDRAGEAVPGEAQPLEELLAQALAARPELLGFERQQAAQVLARKSVRGTLFPSLGLTAAAATARLTNDWAPRLSVGVHLSWSLFEGGARLARLDEADAVQAQLAAQADALRAQVRLEVESAWLTVGSSREALSAAGESVDAAKEQLRLAEGRYRAGAGSSIELSDAQAKLTRASSQAVQAEYQLAAARAQLLAALGRQ